MWKKLVILDLKAAQSGIPKENSFYTMLKNV